MAADIHELARQLGYPQINLVGHDIGLMVAYAYAAQWPGDVKKLVLMDAAASRNAVLRANPIRSAHMAFRLPQRAGNSRNI